MSFEKDIFISYAHIDEEEMTTDEIGWVSAFHHDLEVRVKQVFGAKPVVWRDTQLQSNDDYAKEITDKFPQTKMMVSIISPRYLKSDWCKREVDEFYEVADKTLGVYVGNKGRIFKVVKTYVPIENLPEKLQKMLEYDFFKFEGDSKIPVEFDRKYGNEMEVAYSRKLNELSYNIKDLLEQIDQIEKNGNAISKRKVYVAETSFDLKEYRDILIGELSSNGYDVYPNKNLTREFSENYKAEVAGYIKDCSMSVHLIGSKYGTVMDGSDKSIVVLQNEVAAQQSASAGLERMVWIAPRTENDDEKTISFIKELNENEQFHVQADLLVSSIDDFKTAVVAKLKKQDEKAKELENQKKLAEENAKAGEAILIDNVIQKFIYLICFDKADKKAARPLADVLFEKGYDIVYPVFEGNENSSELHQQRLRDCDAVLIYYGSGNENWFNTNLSSLNGIPGLRRTKKLLGTGVFLAAPSTEEKEDFRSHTITVMDGTEGFDPKLLNDFIAKLK